MQSIDQSVHPVTGDAPQDRHEDLSDDAALGPPAVTASPISTPTAAKAMPVDAAASTAPLMPNSARVGTRPARIEIGDEPLRVVVVDFDMRFSSMVGFMVKWALATIPAVVILAGILVAIFFFIILTFPQMFRR
jgi:hypothetical protein